jgi:hypothetical protein
MRAIRYNCHIISDAYAVVGDVRVPSQVSRVSWRDEYAFFAHFGQTIRKRMGGDSVGDKTPPIGPAYYRDSAYIHV